MRASVCECVWEYIFVEEKSFANVSYCYDNHIYNGCESHSKTMVWNGGNIEWQPKENKKHEANKIVPNWMNTHMAVSFHFWFVFLLLQVRVRRKYIFISSRHWQDTNQSAIDLN